MRDYLNTIDQREVEIHHLYQQKKMAVQKGIDLRESIPENSESTISGTFISPEYAEAAVNLQMDWFLYQRSLINRYLFKSYITVSTLLALSVGYASHVLRPWMSSYNYNHMDRVLRNAEFYFYDLFNILVMIGFFISSILVFLFMRSSSFKFKSQDVPNDTKEFFGVDLVKYAELETNDSKSKSVKIMKDLSYLIVYRETPIALIALDERENELRVTGLGIRRVYYSTGIFEDLMQWGIKKAEEKNLDLKVDIYSFEKFSEKILIDNKFKLQGTKTKNSVYEDSFLTTIYGVIIKEYVYTIGK